MSDMSQVEVVYLPTGAFSPGDEAVVIALIKIEGGREAMLVFSSLDRLMAACGQGQSWVSLQVDRSAGIEELARVCGVDTIVRDMGDPIPVRHSIPKQRGAQS
ncbi:SAV_915 family protein [Actinomadura craniellae]|uniref:SAV_915 family protein n=1 Tax=Actinomadura craniellae TaxID=2231787 RepID=UPI0011BF9614|nr:SAV_915 family protein [Actinomadura craniellae]